MNDNAVIFEPLLDMIKYDDIRKFAERCIDTIPDYFWNVGASSTGKYHPKYAQGEGGLARHTLGVGKILNYMLEIDSVKSRFSDREQDLLRVAAIMHDSRKCGNDNDYAIDIHTRFDHPLLAAQIVRSVDGISRPEREYIATAIESHMGQWNNGRNGKILPLPQRDYQIILHVADYLASRKDIEIIFGGDNDVG